MIGPDGKPRVCDGVWISYLTGMGETNGEGFGKLTAGYGVAKKPVRGWWKDWTGIYVWHHDGPIGLSNRC